LNIGFPHSAHDRAAPRPPSRATEFLPLSCLPFFTYRLESNSLSRHPYPIFPLLKTSSYLSDRGSLPFAWVCSFSPPQPAPRSIPIKTRSLPSVAALFTPTPVVIPLHLNLWVTATRAPTEHRPARPLPELISPTLETRASSDLPTVGGDYSFPCSDTARASHCLRPRPGESEPRSRPFR